MRIIAGIAKGRPLASPRSGTRPMTGRARESLFAILADRLEGADVLDLYAGSGSLGLEALSRGAASATFVEKSPQAAAVIEGNIENIGLGGSVVRGEVRRVVGRLGGVFDIVFVDPPYAMSDDETTSTLIRIAAVVADGGVVIVHRRGSAVADIPNFLTSFDERRYGDAVVTLMEGSPT